MLEINLPPTCTFPHERGWVREAVDRVVVGEVEGATACYCVRGSAKRRTQRLGPGNCNEKFGRMVGMILE